MHDRENRYWWHVGRLKIIDRRISTHIRPTEGAKILNVGCGTGGTIPILKKYGEITNIDTSDEAISFMKQEGYDAEKVTE